ncbi:MAG: hypothetical protein A2275_12840 [Bacteroidetes bacterium RIFOXYA12_FULL_35_11]|nr:MAG: hypothetical protein A2X01_05690 [Bacteroidetes bacterium GWF2_35_48]OFY72598.1 MAG: hypothetical protein A2275_12840 [Bacteroidetes bacterium RIFOXYA12_FULL_35_11]HBX52549.1 hypothetical protein [Bacteroidales bacterium]
MNCTTCKSKECKNGTDCNGNKQEIIHLYKNKETQALIKDASQLVDNGRAGSLSRVEELIEFIKSRKYKKIGVAYCIGFENYAKNLSLLFNANKIKHSIICCITDGIREAEINSEKINTSISCNPIGQALQLKKDNVDLIVEIALCLGHDILFHREINCDITVLVVKDRKYNHCPLEGLKTNINF